MEKMRVFSGKYFPFSIFGQKKCPKLKISNTFGLRKLALTEPQNVK
jgi:hypothetical protein